MSFIAAATAAAEALGLSSAAGAATGLAGAAEGAGLGAGATGAAEGLGAASMAAPMAKGGLLGSWLGKATPQAGNLADNLAAGAGNSGMGGLMQDLKAGNYASAAGNAVQMGQDNAKATALQPPTMAPQPSQSGMPSASTPQGLNSPLLQQFAMKYGRQNGMG